MVRALLVAMALIAAGPCLAQSEREARAFGDLQGILRHGPTGEVYGWSPNGRMRETSFYTRPIATSIRFLCQRDAVQLEYLSSDRVDPSKSSQPSGVRAVRQYRFISDPQMPPVSGEWPNNPFEGDCAKLPSVDEPGWFAATDPYTADTAYRIFRRSLDRVRFAAPPRGCPRKSFCHDYLTGPSLKPFTAATPCMRRGVHYCMELIIPDEMLMRIRFRYKGSGDIVIEDVTLESTAEICV